MLTQPTTSLVKGFYDRLLEDGPDGHLPQGGRVTELVARPLLNLHWPELSHVVQPLAGEWAIRRRSFEQLRIPVGYGVEFAAMLDVVAREGLGSLAQVDLGERAHAHQSVHDLGVMAAEIMVVAARRATAGTAGSTRAKLWQFARGGAPWRGRDVPSRERPPAATIGAVDA
jgi:glucosyl-3-phosphoglycerate synthase